MSIAGRGGRPYDKIRPSPDRPGSATPRSSARGLASNMLAHRLATGLTLVALFLAVIILDEFLAPWFPLWLVTVTVVVMACARELVGLLGATSARPSANCR